jgi:hypothetical protein
MLSMADPATAGPSLALALLLSLRLYERRPRGSLTPGLLEVRPSLIAGAGRGCFAAVDIPAATILGTYPGRLRSAHDYALKLAHSPHVAQYCWTIGDVAALDPTDERGNLLENPGVPLLESTPAVLNRGIFAPLAKPTTLALINEPGAGGDVNTKVEIEGDQVYFITERLVAAGEEIYIDYGQTYDRSGYGRST